MGSVRVAEERTKSGAARPPHSRRAKTMQQSKRSARMTLPEIAFEVLARLSDEQVLALVEHARKTQPCPFCGSSQARQEHETE
jgi:hypothetical protein